MQRRYLLIMAGAVLLTGFFACEPPCEESSCTTGSPLLGDASQFILGPQDTETIDISGVESCQDQFGDRVLLTTYGSRSVDYGGRPSPDSVDGHVWFYGILMPALNARDVEVHVSYFGTSCRDNDTRYVVAISDWSQSNDAARVIGRSMLDNDLNLQVELQIAEEPRICADSGCY